MTDATAPTEVRSLPVTDVSLVVLVGTTGAGKSSFARKHFLPTQVISSDYCRGLVADDENDQSASTEAFELLHYIVGKRLAAGRLTVVDATNVQQEARKQLIKIARDHDVLPIAIVLDIPPAVCAERNLTRPDRQLPAHVIPRQQRELRRSLRGLEREGFRKVHILRGEAEVDAAEIVIEKRYNDLRHLTGPFDIVGDIHGCRSELETLLTRLGYTLTRDEQGRPVDAAHPEGRTAVFVGDLVDRGPDTPGVLRLVMGMVAAGHAVCVPGNHENKLGRHMDGRKVTVSHGLQESLDQLAGESEEFRTQVRAFMRDLVSHYLLDGGNLVVCHAGLPEKYHGRNSGRVRSHALYGDTTGETDEYGLPVRYPWAEEYRGRALVVYGHTPVPTASFVNNTICLDTGCVFGGSLTALRYPERELVSVEAEQEWYAPVRPMHADAPGAREGRPLDLADVAGRRIVETTQHGRVSIREENSAAALEVMSRFALDPRLLAYLPPTMAPSATSRREGYLEHPEEAFFAYRNDGVQHVICEEKHMGSRAVVLVARDGAALEKRFGIEGPGAIWTRTGRAFLNDDELTGAVLDRVRAAAERAGLFEELNTGWLLLDAELMPWSLKAVELLRRQYAAVGAAAAAALPQVLTALDQASGRGLEVGALADRQRQRAVDAEAFTAAYRRYCWPTEGLSGIRLAPFQVLAAEGANLAVRPHDEHLGWIDRLVAADDPQAPILQRTGRLVVDTSDEASIAAGLAWWEELTGAGGEGMVVKPLASLARGKAGEGRPGGLIQPGVKVRGREYLRIIYGPDYTRYLDQLRQRFLGHKRSLALREYALGLEALDRLAAGEPLWRVHEPVFAVLALESEPVDPRL
ncbi:polynucleotide kinase-phosphatase [Kitasatospora atroaurantiaca]|uniref:Polynucleotide 3'-phosphatase /polynucleotide 5'-hydroxyl-kinase /polynucleotide 2',3'-cyclic phosphate phosphodiesterase n=1 Tax=Kitasatospora atroaurantiaca TaxID=285545 RepID=A0A561EP11_9ACTN|nr:polynucleotide kinase-phosphatase [Kitasatospora atroaurantiaca]TWE17361.1 polynucleotide 3'-phosphatase /polynucleotide 5'-hydroxyl-kinase /polynucleotide 2',3'-cyclic phosphate phosphodiesterase [Kitasatospora atroaurantiaca]